MFAQKMISFIIIIKSRLIVSDSFYWIIVVSGTNPGLTKIKIINNCLVEILLYQRLTITLL
jgi:hypothetical protein